MAYGVVYSSEFIIITSTDEGYFIESYKNGMSVDQFNKLMGLHPEIRVTSFMAIKNALMFAPKPPVKFGESKDRVHVDISSDELRASVTLNILEVELTSDRRVGLTREIINRLAENGIVFGVKREVLLGELIINKPILIAEGTLPENGQDAIIKMYEIKDSSPEIKEDGNVDHYELSLINRVESGEWLGERIDPTPGIAGKTVKGTIIPAMPGKKYPILYDKKSVREVDEDGVTRLYSLRNGAVHYEGDKIGVSNHLELVNGVDFKTGNIDFDGYITVKGHVEDNFSVVADKDIEILGDYGVGCVKEIVSRDGSIFIKGGIAGKNKAVIKSTKNIYTKFVSDATIICEGSLHIGFYCINSFIKAKEVILDSPKGQIIGGNVEAEIKVVVSVLGNNAEKRTSVVVKGFERKVLRDRLESVVMDLEVIKNDFARMKQEIAIYSSADQLTKELKVKFEIAKEKFFLLKDKLKEYEDEKKLLVGYLRTHGEGEVSILKKVFPKVAIQIKKEVKEIVKITNSTCYYIQDGEIKEV